MAVYWGMENNEITEIKCGVYDVIPDGVSGTKRDIKYFLRKIKDIDRNCILIFSFTYRSRSQSNPLYFYEVFPVLCRL